MTLELDKPYTYHSDTANLLIFRSSDTDSFVVGNLDTFSLEPVGGMVGNLLLREIGNVRLAEPDEYKEILDFIKSSGDEEYPGLEEYLESELRSGDPVNLTGIYIRDKNLLLSKLNLKEDSSAPINPPGRLGKYYLPDVDNLDPYSIVRRLEGYISTIQFDMLSGWYYILMSKTIRIKDQTIEIVDNIPNSVFYNVVNPKHNLIRMAYEYGNQEVKQLVLDYKLGKLT